MEKMIRYEIEGMVLDVPLRYDKLSGRHIEDYREYIENSIFTPQGHPVIFAGEDACPHGAEASPGGCPDCGSCRFFKRAGEHTWIGLCQNERNKRTLCAETNSIGG